jgi:hypothetical protein
VGVGGGGGGGARGESCMRVRERSMCIRKACCRTISKCGE